MAPSAIVAARFRISMRATGFERRHGTLLRQILVLAAFLTYLLDRDDVVWRFIKNGPEDVRLLERVIFALCTVIFGVAACLCARSRVHRTSRSPLFIGKYLYALALGSLALF
jgi:hypothetical protein